MTVDVCYLFDLLSRNTIPDLVAMITSFFDADLQIALSDFVPKGPWQLEDVSLICALEKEDCSLLQTLQKKQHLLVHCSKWSTTLRLVREGLDNTKSWEFTKAWIQYWQNKPQSLAMQNILCPLLSLQDATLLQVRKNLLERATKVVDFYLRMELKKQRQVQILESPST
jgi:hypothetical protein